MLDPPAIKFETLSSKKKVEKILVSLLSCVKGLREVEYFSKIAAAAAVPVGHTTEELKCETQMELESDWVRFISDTAFHTGGQSPITLQLPATVLPEWNLEKPQLIMQAVLGLATWSSVEKFSWLKCLIDTSLSHLLHT